MTHSHGGQRNRAGETYAMPLGQFRANGVNHALAKWGANRSPKCSPISPLFAKSPKPTGIASGATEALADMLRTCLHETDWRSVAVAVLMVASPLKVRKSKSVILKPALLRREVKRKCGARPDRIGCGCIAMPTTLAMEAGRKKSANREPPRKTSPEICSLDFLGTSVGALSASSRGMIDCRSSFDLVRQ